MKRTFLLIAAALLAMFMGQAAAGYSNIGCGSELLCAALPSKPDHPQSKQANRLSCSVLVAPCKLARHLIMRHLTPSCAPLLCSRRP